MSLSSQHCSCWLLVASFTKRVNSRLAKRPLVFIGRLANRRLPSLVKEATGIALFCLVIFRPVLTRFGRHMEQISWVNIFRNTNISLAQLPFFLILCSWCRRHRRFHGNLVNACWKTHLFRYDWIDVVVLIYVVYTVDAYGYFTCMQVNLHTCVYIYVYVYKSKVFCFIKWRNCHKSQARHIINPRNLDLLEHRCERAADGATSSPLGFLGLLRWRCDHSGGFPLWYVRAVIRGVCLMFYDTFVSNFELYCLWRCIYYHWCLSF